MGMLRQNRGQQMGEYAVLVGMVAAAMLSMQMFISHRVAGRLIDTSHQILGTAQPSNDGTSSSDSFDRVRQMGAPGNIHTQIASTSTGQSSAGFILAEAYGPYLGEALTLSATSVDYLASQLCEDCELLGITADESGMVSLLLKDRAGNKGPLTYKVTRLTYDKNKGLWYATVDVNGTQVYLAGLPKDLLDKVVMLDALQGRLSSTYAWMAALEEFLAADDEGELPIDLSDQDRAIMIKGIEAGKQIVRIIRQSLGPTRPLADLSTTDLKKRKSRTESPWQTLREAVAKADRLAKENNRLAKDNAKKMKELTLWHDVTWHSYREGKLLADNEEPLSIQEFAYDRETINVSSKNMKKFIEGLEKDTEEGPGLRLEHRDEIAKHLKKAATLVDDENLAPEVRGFSIAKEDQDETNRALQAASDELDTAYDLLAADLDTVLGLGEEAPAEQPSEEPKTTLAKVRDWFIQNFRSQDPITVLEDGKQVDVKVAEVFDQLPDMVKADGEVQELAWIVVEPSTVGGLLGEGVPLQLAQGVAKQDRQELANSATLPIPQVERLPDDGITLEEIRAAGKHPNDFRNITAWTRFRPGSVSSESTPLFSPTGELNELEFRDGGQTRGQDLKLPSGSCPDPNNPYC